jgi:predicted RND superfamily exporter protein
VLNKRLSEHRDEFMKGDYLAEDAGQELWRINVRVAALKNVDYGAFVGDIKGVVEPIITAEREKGVQGLAGVTYTGLTPLVYKAQHSLLSGLVDSFCWAFVMIAVVMALNFRSVMAGLLAMIPTVWPVAIVFGGMGWLGIPIDIGTMMTAGVAMGVCVDDTVHYGTWFRRGLRMGLNRIEATRFAFEHAAAAMYQSNFVVGFGLAAFGISAFMPTRRFGLLMLTLLMFGLLADLVLTPAIMAGPFGRFFSKWWIKPKELEKPAAMPDDSRQDAAGEAIPAPHIATAPEPKILPMPTAARRLDQGKASGGSTGMGIKK